MRHFKDLELVDGRLRAEFGGETSPLVNDIQIMDGDAIGGRYGEALDAPPARARQVIWVNMEGGTYTGTRGSDDSAQRRSWIIGKRGYSSRQFRPYGTAAERDEVFNGVRDLFARFNVLVTRQRPTSGDFVDCIVTASPGSTIGCSCGGIAPMRNNCSVITKAIVFVFASRLGSTRRIAEVAAQEIGHAFGLEHELLKEDPMSYLAYAQGKTFQDKYAPCGEYQARACQCGGTQNTVQELLRKFGRREGAEPTPGNANIRFITPASADAAMRGNREIEIVVEATDPQNVAKVELIWDHTGRALDCAAGGNGVDWSCSKEGNIYTWKLEVGTGSRTYRVRVTDAAAGGNARITTSPTRTLRLTSEEAATCGMPAVQLVEIKSSADGQPLGAASDDADTESPYVALARGQIISLTARATSSEPGKGIHHVHVMWQDAHGLSQSIMERVADDLWQLEVLIGPGTEEGMAHLMIEATDYGGRTAVTAPELIHVRAA
jgi:hypothetical protein